MQLRFGATPRTQSFIWNVRCDGCGSDRGLKVVRRYEVIDLFGIPLAPVRKRFQSMEASCPQCGKRTSPPVVGAHGLAALPLQHRFGFLILLAVVVGGFGLYRGYRAYSMRQGDAQFARERQSELAVRDQLKGFESHLAPGARLGRDAEAMRLARLVGDELAKAKADPDIGVAVAIELSKPGYVVLVVPRNNDDSRIFEVVKAVVGKFTPPPDEAVIGVLHRPDGYVTGDFVYATFQYGSWAEGHFDDQLRALAGPAE